MMRNWLPKATALTLALINHTNLNTLTQRLNDVKTRIRRKPWRIKIFTSQWKANSLIIDTSLELMSDDNERTQLSENLKSISWNRSNIFPASNYLATSLKLLGCTEVHYKLYKIQGGEFDITLSYTCNDTRANASFRCTRKIRKIRSEEAYALLLNSLLFKQHCMQNFGVHLPLPASWDIDNLKLNANNDFTSTPLTTDMDSSDLMGRLHNLEQRVGYLELKFND